MMPNSGRQSLWIRLVELFLATRLIGPNILRNEGATHRPHTKHYICDFYKRRESTNFTHIKIVCFVIIFDLLRLVVLSYKQEENLCILRRRDVLSLHFLFLFSSFDWRSLVYCSCTSNFRVNEKEGQKNLNHLINLKIIFFCSLAFARQWRITYEH